ncbi:hypothetical protein Y032_0056g2714 [Ancylostoma ceylanicum]|uniref:BPTI/Kunitz inhibitor domain-containing protein n=1 Tax=Ancylostoma ceylanicum TaxID=53326 RepID=A0A016U5D5_9BILA|nr:hypothetical protein Y032_0056g2714 [Ancylostoma ceylanicum]
MNPIVAILLCAASGTALTKFFFHCSRGTFNIPVAAIINERCLQQQEHGPCKGFEPRYSYNKATDECELFYYGGCLGNENRFKSKKQCERTCRRKHSLDLILVGPGRMPIQPIDDPGNFSIIIFRDILQILGELFTLFQILVPKSPICYQPIKQGPCLGFLQRYAYDASKRKCVEFTYGGCGGNQNNFERMRECEFTCLVNMPTS